MQVSRKDLERRLAELEREVEDARAGLWGPKSAMWQRGRELINFAGGGRAALLQLAHPFVARAISEHSPALSDPRGRFRRTFRQVFAMTFGDLEEAFTAARQVHAVHARIGGRLDEDIGPYRRGARYAANEVSALFWVHATLIDTVLVVHDELAGGLSGAEKERYYQESKRGAALFGIPDEQIPPDYRAFRTYFETCLGDGTIVVSRAARAIAGQLLSAPRAALAPASALYRFLTAGLLPASVRAGYGYSFGPAERLGYRATARSISALYPLAPKSLVENPAYAQAARRLGAGGARGPLARAFEEALSRSQFWP